LLLLLLLSMSFLLRWNKRYMVPSSFLVFLFLIVPIITLVVGFHPKATVVLQQQQQHPFLLRPKIRQIDTASRSIVTYSSISGSSSSGGSSSSSSSSGTTNKNNINRQNQKQMIASELEPTMTTTSTTTMKTESSTTTTTTTITKSPQERSTLILLEHINLNIPQDHSEYVIPFYIHLLGCGIDPRRAENVVLNETTTSSSSSTSTITTTKGTIWANCGASQFHLPHGPTAQRIPGKIGLRFRSDCWEEFQRRVQTVLQQQQQQQQPPFSLSSVRSTTSSMDRFGNTYIELTDAYDNVFLCRPDNNNDKDATVGVDHQHRLVDHLRQPIVSVTDTDQWGALATNYGKEQSDCSGIDFVEFACPKGTAEKIALFYDACLDATVSVVSQDDGGGGGGKIAIVAVGGSDDTRHTADQSLIFRETDPEMLPDYDGHHIAMYIGETVADFEQAYRNCELAGIVWVNPRFRDRADTIAGAREWKQFRFKNIIDMETGATIMELEHEMRSVAHEAWIGMS
jgi:hypothetical protein